MTLPANPEFRDLPIGTLLGYETFTRQPRRSRIEAITKFYFRLEDGTRVSRTHGRIQGTGVWDWRYAFVVRPEIPSEAGADA